MCMTCVKRIGAWRLPPLGGSGLKYINPLSHYALENRLPPLGGSGLKLQCRDFVRYAAEGLPPLGGSGLKCLSRNMRPNRIRLPPLGGSGLKCARLVFRHAGVAVSLPSEGVD